MEPGDELEVALASGGTLTVVVDNEAECRSCGEPIVWGITPNGKKMPCDLPDDDDDTHTVSHFSTCPESEAWRKRQRTS
jgi:hypothetical protein